MTITSAGSSPIAWQAGQAQLPLRRHHEKMVEPAAKALGISTDDLRTQLKAGKSLSDVAAAQGVSNDDLVAAIAAELKANAPQGAAPLGEAQLTRMATNIVDHKRGEGRGPGGPTRSTRRARRALRATWPAWPPASAPTPMRSRSSSCGATRAPSPRAHRGTPAAPRPPTACSSTRTPDA